MKVPSVDFDARAGVAIQIGSPWEARHVGL